MLPIFDFVYTIGLYSFYNIYIIIVKCFVPQKHNVFLIMEYNLIIKILCLSLINKKMMKFFNLLMFVMLFVSCSMDQNVVVNDVSLTGEAVSYKLQPHKINTPELVFRTFFITNELECYTINYLDKTSYKSDTLFHIGKGRNEFQRVRLSFDQNNNLYILNQPYMGDRFISITVISNTDSIESIKNKKEWDRYDLSQMPPCCIHGDGFVVLSDSTILTTGAPYDAINGHLMSIVNYKSQKVQPIEYWPDDGIETDSLPKMTIYSSNAKLFGNGEGHFLYQCGTQRFVFLFSIENNHVNVIKELYCVYPRYKSDESKMDFVIEPNSPTGRLNCCADNKHIYVLLMDSDKNGKKLESWSPDNYGNIVEVYDWEGVIQEKIRLDKYGQRIMISQEENKLYLFTDDYEYENSQPEIWAYDLRNL